MAASDEGWRDVLINASALAVTAALIAFGVRVGYRAGVKVMGADVGEPKVVREAHVDPEVNAHIARNFGDRERIATERGIMAGSAVGQTMSYIGGFEPYWATLRGTVQNDTVGQNFAGRAVGMV